MPQSTAEIMERLARLEAQVEHLNGVKDMHGDIAKRVGELERWASAQGVLTQSLPGDLNGLCLRMEAMEQWRAASGEILRDRIDTLEAFRDKLNGKIGLIDWALRGGIAAIVGLIALVLSLVQSGWKP